MVANHAHNEDLINLENPTDIEIAIRILRLLDDPEIFNRGDDPSSGRTFILSMAENAVKTMTNPFAKKMLTDEILK